MTLAYLGVSRSQRELAQQLGVLQHVGAPASSLLRLRSPTIDVIFRTEAHLDDIQQWLERRLPAIAFVQTGQLSYWRGQVAQHSVVIVGMDHRSVYLLDPGQPEAVITVQIEEFWLAWDEIGLAFGVTYRR